MTAPERITLTHKGIGKTAFSGWGAVDMASQFKADYVRKDLADRSQKSHGHEFATINDMWETLPERFKDAPWATTADTMRKHALINCEYCDVLPFFYTSKEHALREAPAVKQTLISHHGYAIGSGTESDNGGFVVVYKIPHSQSKKAMGATAFQESKQAVLDWCKDLLQIDDDLNIAGTG